jgi:hypothetical protein
MRCRARKGSAQDLGRVEPGKPSGTRLSVNKVANVGEDTVTQIHAKQACAEPGVQLSFKTLENVGRQIGLFAEKLQERGAIRWALIVAGQAACRTDRQRKGNRSRSLNGAIGRLGDEVDSHAGRLTLD